MKKIALILALMMCVSLLSGCGETNEQPTQGVQESKPAATEPAVTNPAETEPGTTSPETGNPETDDPGTATDPGTAGRTERMYMRSVAGMEARQAKQLLQNEMGLAVNVQEEHSAAVAQGYVTRFSPSEGMLVEKGTTVTIWVSKGPAKSEPVGPGPADPTTKPGNDNPGIADPGNTDPGTPDPGNTDPGTPDPGNTDPGTTDPGTTDPGTTDPEPGSAEKDTVPMVYVVGRSVDVAAEMITNLGLKVGQIMEFPDDQPAGTVIRQSVDIGTEVKKGTAIDLWVSKGPADAEPPDGGPEATLAIAVDLSGYEGTVAVRVVVGDKTVFDGMVDADMDTGKTVYATASGTQMVHIYINDALVDNYTLDFT